MPELIMCIGNKIPLFPGKANYLTPLGENPLPSVFPSHYLSIVLKSLELDGWLSKREVNELIEISESIEDNYISFEELEAVWGEPFRTIRMFFYGKNISVKSEETIFSFWIPPQFATLSVALAAVLFKERLVISWMDLFDSGQKRFILSLLSRREPSSLICFFDKTKLSSMFKKLIIDIESINDIQLNVPLKNHIDKANGKLIELSKINGLWIPTGKIYDFVNFKGGCIPRIPRKINYLKTLFKEEASLIYEILDELLNNMPMSLSVFLSILREYFKNSKNVARIFRLLTCFKIISISQANVYLTERGVKFYENFFES
ncbi:MAG: hypothetical protein DRJ38_10375 [Thermoprotei archaeon]|nr:MAG: hypothetical protein DRJ38_10375 [Thermoprotei archaeon]